MEWNVTMLALHVFALVFAVLLVARAPCWMQKLVVVLLAAAFLVMSVAYAAALARFDGWFWLAFLAFAIEHIAVLLYVFRVVWQGGLGHGPVRRAAAAR